MKKSVQYSILVVFIFGMFLSGTTTARATTMQPKYVVIRSLQATLSISEQGRASCVGQLLVASGYTTHLTMELKRDGITIMTWRDSGSSSFTMSKPYYVTSGHTYSVTATATVYNANNQIVETQSHSSPARSY